MSWSASLPEEAGWYWFRGQFPVAPHLMGAVCHDGKPVEAVPVLVVRDEHGCLHVGEGSYGGDIGPYLIDYGNGELSVYGEWHPMTIPEARSTAN